MKTVSKILLGIAVPFALAAGIALDYQYDKNRRVSVGQKTQSDQEKLKQKYDNEVIPALRDMALSRCGDPDANIHGLLLAKFIYDSNRDDGVRRLLKSKKVDPHHYGSYEMHGGDGYMNLEDAHKFAAFLLKENIAATAEPDRHKGQRQIEYLNNGTGGGRLVIYYQPAPSDYDSKNKPWIPEDRRQIPSDGIYVPMSAALGTFLYDLMNGKYKDIAHYQVAKVPGTENGWEIKIKKLTMDGPAAPVQFQKPAPATN